MSIPPLAFTRYYDYTGPLAAEPPNLPIGGHHHVSRGQPEEARGTPDAAGGRPGAAATTDGTRGVHTAGRRGRRSRPVSRRRPVGVLPLAASGRRSRPLAASGRGSRSLVAASGGGSRSLLAASGGGSRSARGLPDGQRGDGVRQDRPYRRSGAPRPQPAERRPTRGRPAFDQCGEGAPELDGSAGQPAPGESEEAGLTDREEGVDVRTSTSNPTPIPVLEAGRRPQKVLLI